MIALPSFAAESQVTNSQRVGAAVYDMPFAFDVHAGIGTPLGFTGFEANVSPVRYLTIGGGLGLGLHGIQESGMARLRLPINRFAFAFGGGLSGGTYDAVDLVTDSYFASHWHWKQAWWANFEGSLEFRDTTGVQLRGYVGWAHMVNPTASGCENDAAGKCPDQAGGFLVTSFPYVGMSIGYAFSL